MKSFSHKIKLLILGANGMLGNAALRVCSDDKRLDAFASVRSNSSIEYFHRRIRPRIVGGVDVENPDNLIRLFEIVNPDVVVNCVGLIKQVSHGADPLAAIAINALFPHRLARLCKMCSARLIHISTDCVYSGKRGMYSEDDRADADDLYGRSKFLGEVDYPHAVTLRTSIVGHELAGARSLVGWFLAQKGVVKGYRRAVFSGLTSVEVCRVIIDHVLPNPTLRGLYHVSSDPINKYNLLKLVAKVYGKTNEIIPDDEIVIDRSLDSRRFRNATGFIPKSWADQIRVMNEFK
jgi:dTDP-4-dehydrorhamnose reductase